MQTKQYSVKVFEVILESEEEFISFFDKNSIFFQDTLLSIQGEPSDSIEAYLEERELQYIFNKKLPKSKRTKEKNRSKEKQEPIEEAKQEEKREEKKEPTQEEKKDNLRVIDKLVRSGQELKIDGDLLLLNRVNSGGSINITGNLIITQIVEGDIRCYGNFMMLKASPKANIVFHEVEVDNSYLQDKLNRVELIENEIRITPVLKETKWA